MELFKVFTVEETKEIINKTFNKSLEYEEVSLIEGLGRITYEDITSKENVPSFKRSTVDGYAVRFKDVAGASDTIPAMMNIKGEVLMGLVPNFQIDHPGECAYVPTGGMIPEGADAVVMVEYTEKLDDVIILINSAVAFGDNIVDIGEDIKSEELIIRKGTKLRAYEIGVLSSIGIMQVKVFKKPKVAIISTGDEIIDCTKSPALGEVRDINSNLLHALIVESGGNPINFGVIKDDYKKLEDTLEEAIEKCDVVIVSGGSSVGKKDQTLKVINQLQKDSLLVHGIAIKPGKPTIIAKIKHKPVFGLPGHPLSCAIIYNEFVKYHINNLCSFKEENYPTMCSFEINYHKAKGREEFLPVVLTRGVDGRISASPILSKSGLITGFSKAWGYIKINRNEEGLLKGQTVQAYKF